MWIVWNKKVAKRWISHLTKPKKRVPNDFCMTNFYQTIFVVDSPESCGFAVCVFFSVSDQTFEMARIQFFRITSRALLVPTDGIIIDGYLILVESVRYCHFFIIPKHWEKNIFSQSIIAEKKICGEFHTMNFEMCGFIYSNKCPLIKSAHITCFYKLMDSLGFDGKSQSTPANSCMRYENLGHLIKFQTTKFPIKPSKL